jgi:hypothetical protein
MRPNFALNTYKARSVFAQPFPTRTSSAGFVMQEGGNEKNNAYYKAKPNQIARQGETQKTTYFPNEPKNMLKTKGRLKKTNPRPTYFAPARAENTLLPPFFRHRRRPAYRMDIQQEPVPKCT